VHQLFAAVFAAAGRGGDIVRVFGGQIGDSNSIATNTVAYCNAHSLPLDAYCEAIYIDNPGDTAFVTAAAACASSLTTSTQHGTSWPWTMADYHKLFQHHLLYGTLYRGYMLAATQALAGYSVPGKSTPQYVAYEGGIEGAIPGGVGTAGNDAALQAGLTHDFFFHPAMYDTVQVWHLLCAAGGLSTTCYFSLAGITSPTQLWYLASQAGQQAGRGDGSDGLATNVFYVADTKSHYLENVSPGLAGFQAFAAVANPPIPPSTGGRPKKWYPGLRRLAAGLVR
jgi:hypothetical protein